MKLTAKWTCLFLVLLMLLSGCGPGQDSEFPTSFTVDELRLLAFGAVLTARNPMDYNSLFGWEDDNNILTVLTLSNMWNIDNRTTALYRLEWLKDSGQREPAEDRPGYNEIYRTAMDAGFNERWDIDSVSIEMLACKEAYHALRRYYRFSRDDLDAVTCVSAWDYDRLVTIARWCYGCGYITEEEAWYYIHHAARMGAEDYDSWESYFAGVIFGRAIWSGDLAFSSQNREVADSLFKDKGSIYRAVTFLPPDGDSGENPFSGPPPEDLLDPPTGENEPRQELRTDFGITQGDLFSAVISEADYPATVTQEDDYATVTIGTDDGDIYSIVSCMTEPDGMVSYVGVMIFPEDGADQENLLEELRETCALVAELTGADNDIWQRMTDPEEMRYSTRQVNEGQGLLTTGTQSLDSGHVRYLAEFVTSGEDNAPLYANANIMIIP